MTEQIASEAQTPLLDSDAFSRYLVHEPREIVAILNGLAEKRALVTAYLDGGLSFITAVLAVTADGTGLILDASSDESTNARATAASRLMCVSHLDKVRVQFSVPALERFPHDGYLALRSPLPESVLRLQRREYYRLSAPVGAPPICTIRFKSTGGEAKSVPLKVLDISGGGVAVVVPPAGLELASGMEFADCLLTLPEGEPLPVRIRICNLFHVERSGSGRMLRAGCEFIGLSNNDVARIQRYIFKIERERKARENGF